MRPLRGRVQLGLIVVGCLAAFMGVAGVHGQRSVVAHFDKAHEELQTEALTLETLRALVLATEPRAYQAAAEPTTTGRGALRCISPDAQSSGTNSMTLASSRTGALPDCSVLLVASHAPTPQGDDTTS